MHQRLGIPLGNPVTTRRDTRRVVALASGVLVGLCVGILAFRAPFAISRTLGKAPEGAATMRLLKTSGTVDALETHMWNRAILPGAPWKVETLLAESNRELTIAFLPNGEAVYIIDRAIPTEMRETAVAFGLQAIVQGNTTVIAPANVAPQSERTRLRLVGLFPWYEGEVNSGEARGSVRVSAKGITFGIGVAAETPRARVPKNSNVLVHLTATAQGNGIPERLAILLSSPTGAIVDLLNDYGGTLAISEDESSQSYILTTSPGEMTSEELASIGRDIMNRSALSTQAWTLADGSTYEEIVGNSDDVAVEVQAEDGFTYVSLRNSKGDVTRMTKLADVLTITNRDIDITQGARAQSQCLGSAHTWLHSAPETRRGTASVTTTEAVSTFMQFFSEFAISNGKIRLCW